MRTQDDYPVCGILRDVPTGDFRGGGRHLGGRRLRGLEAFVSESKPRQIKNGAI